MRVQPESNVHHAAPPAGLAHGPILQRKCACGQHTHGGAECDACRKKGDAKLQRRAIATPGPAFAPPIVHNVLRSSGQPLDAATRFYFEPRFGQDFSGVRIHADSQTASAAEAVNALAYTVGSDIHFGTGQFAPTSTAGRRLLAHELAHVTQQMIGHRANNQGGSGIFKAPAVPQTLQVNDVNDPLEHEADRLADAAFNPMNIGRRTELAGIPTNDAPRMFRQPKGDVPTKAEEKADQKLNRMATFPDEALSAWKRLNGTERSLIVLKMLGRYGEAFAKDFLDYANGKKNKRIFTTFSNLPSDNPKSLTKRGYRLAGNVAGGPTWVHPSGHEIVVIQSSPPSKTEPAVEKPPDEEPEPVEREPDLQEMLQQDCVEPCAGSTDSEDDCNKCCEKFPASDERCRRACEIGCAMKL
jgi:hypothetical protein